MAEMVFNGLLTNESRPGFALAYNDSGDVIRYTVLNIVGGVDLFMYCNKCSNFSLRNEDREYMLSLHKLRQSVGLNAIKARYDWLECNLPPCGCGGHFGLWENFKSST